MTPARPVVVIAEVTQIYVYLYLSNVWLLYQKCAILKVEAMMFDGKITFVYCLFFGFVTLQFTYFKGLGHQMIFLKACSIKWVLSVLYANGFQIFWLPCQRVKINIKFMLASMEALTYSKECSKSRIKSYVTAFNLCHLLNFFSILVMAIFNKNSRLSECFLETCAAFWMPQQVLWRGFLKWFTSTG